MTPKDKEARRTFVKSFPRHGVAAEIGVQLGGFSELALKYSEPKEYHMIDCWEHQDGKVGCSEPQDSFDEMYRIVMDKFQGYDNVHIHMRYSGDAVTLFDDEYFDWLYIDGDHTYGGVSGDIEKWWPKVKFGGYLAGHDYYQRGEEVEVKRAVDEFLTTKGLDLSFTSPARRPDWAVERVCF